MNTGQIQAASNIINLDGGTAGDSETLHHPQSDDINSAMRSLNYNPR